MDKRFHQANKEALWAVALTLIYLLSWAAAAYLPNDKIGLVGLPRWFEISCLLLPLLFTFLCWLMVQFLFKNMPLETIEHDKSS